MDATQEKPNRIILVCKFKKKERDGFSSFAYGGENVCLHSIKSFAMPL